MNYVQTQNDIATSNKTKNLPHLINNMRKKSSSSGIAHHTYQNTIYPLTKTVTMAGGINTP